MEGCATGTTPVTKDCGHRDMNSKEGEKTGGDSVFWSDCEKN